MPATSRKSSKTRTRTSTRNNNSGMDAIALLKTDHKKVRQLLTQLRETTERSVDRRQQLLTQIENELKIHTTIEEEIFYPAFEDAVRSRDDKKLYYEALEEHKVVDLVMPEIKGTSPGEIEFGAKAKVLQDIVEHHIEEEEGTMFPKARRTMGTAQLKELGLKMEDRKHELSTSMFTRAFERMTGSRKRVA